MPSAGQVALAATEAAGHTDWKQCCYDHYLERYHQEVKARQDKLMHDARAVFRALEGWRSVETEEDWLATVRKAKDDLDSGRFLIDQLGAERYLDPVQMAVLFILRRKLIDEECGGQPTAADLMVVDATLICYRHLMRVNGWTGDFAVWTEREAFGPDGPTVKWDQRQGSYAAQKLKIEDVMSRLGEELLPLLDRLMRMLARNLRTLRMLHAKPAANVLIGRAGQVNVAESQTNTVIERAGVAPNTSNMQAVR